ncbi:hypothetical protein QNI19_05860 [Cytophagaceae bacterium DM2B3-1]|uniref:Uncharacterized protein n=1 Tax=Xanthocytophaga flava TaxID=3048013 RepID=A0ABT7CFC3_9BACT|nr:hypothetical protein [Xanthocytophaga flavus]MDJ1492446.1 hypothetical protein [Xanthocytophaga flavus]
MLTKVKNLTQTAQVAFFTLSALHVIHVLKDKRSLTLDLLRQAGKPVWENINEDEWNNTGEQLYNWCLDTYQQITSWMGEKDMFGDFFMIIVLVIKWLTIWATIVRIINLWKRIV